MTRTRVLVMLSFVIAFAAGMALMAVLSGSMQTHRRPQSDLNRQLKLTPEQHKQMGEIWSETMQNWMRTYGERRRALAAERDQLVQGLFTPAQQVQYDAIMQEYERKLSELAQEGGKAREAANKRTMDILTESQRKTFEEITRQREVHGWGPPGRGPGRNSPPPPPGHPGD